VLVCCSFQELINVYCQVLEQFLGELGGYENTEFRVKVNKVSWEEVLSMKDTV